MYSAGVESTSGQPTYPPPGQYGYGQPPPTAGPFTPMALSAMPGSNFAVNVPNMSEANFLTLYNNQLTQSRGAMEYTAGVNAGGAGINAIDDMWKVGFQYGAEKLHYEFLNKSIDSMATVEENRNQLQRDAMAAAERMQGKQIDHEEKIAKIGAGLQRQLALIAADTKEEIAKTLALRESFSIRSSYDSGTPWSR